MRTLKLLVALIVVATAAACGSPDDDRSAVDTLVPPPTGEEQDPPPPGASTSTSDVASGGPGPSTTNTTMPLGAPSTSNPGRGSPTAGRRGRPPPRDQAARPRHQRDRDDQGTGTTAADAGEHDDAGGCHHATQRHDGDNFAHDCYDGAEAGTDDLVRPATWTLGLRRAEGGRGIGELWTSRHL